MPTFVGIPVPAEEDRELPPLPRSVTDRSREASHRGNVLEHRRPCRPQHPTEAAKGAETGGPSVLTGDLR